MSRTQEVTRTSPSAEAVSLPTISVVVPFRRSERCVFDCLESILDMDYPFEKLDVIAVDDGHDDEMVKLMRRRLPLVRIIRNGASAGSDKAKQLGIEAATGEVLALTDADCTVHPRWARVIAKSLSEGADVVTGPVRHPKAFLKELVAASDFQDFQGVAMRNVSSFPGCNFAVRREAFLPIAYQRNASVRFGSDRLTSWLMHRNGFTITYNPAMVVEHSPSVSLAGILERRMRYGRKAVALRRLDDSLPGGGITRLGLLAAPAYVCFRSAKDLCRVIEMAAHRAVNPWHVPLIIPALFLFRLMDAAGMIFSRESV